MNKCCEKLKPFASVFLRVGLGVIFLYHGYGKVFGETAGLGSSWNPHGMPAIMQALVAWGEFLCGAGILLGFLTELASLGIIIIMTGAIITVHGAKGFSMMSGGFEYNYALIMMCLALIALGSGPYSIGPKCKKD